GSLPVSYSCTIVKVGLLTGSSIPSPRASPWVNTVFPTPRSPTRVKIHPGLACSPRRFPSSKVSSGLFVSIIIFFSDICSSFLLLSADFILLLRDVLLHDFKQFSVLLSDGCLRPYAGIRPGDIDDHAE